METNPGHEAKNGTNGRPGITVIFRDTSLKIGTVPEKPWTDGHLSFTSFSISK